MHRLVFSVFLVLGLFFRNKAENFYIGVNQSSFVPIEVNYDCSIVNSLHEVRGQVIKNFALTTESGIEVPTTFYDRSSKVLLIAGSPLPVPKEGMRAFAKLFPSFDVATFDYRWSGRYGKFLANSILSGGLIQRVLFDPIEELEAVVHYAVKQKRYEKVIGLGECYSCFHFAKLQSNAIEKYGVGPFTHLIFDSCWSSLRDFAERVCYDPLLPIDSRDGGAPKIIRWITDSFYFKKAVLGLLFSLIDNVSVEEYVSGIGVPLLFIHGKNDLFVPLEHFNKIWSVANKENRAAFLTPYKHVDNLGNKKLYRYVVEQFVKSQSTYDFSKKISKDNCF